MLLLLTLACSPDEADPSSSPDPSSVVDPDTGGSTPPSEDVRHHFRSVTWGIDVVWERADDGHVAIALTDGVADGFVLGLAETRSGVYGWYGEDCGPWGGICHAFDAPTGTLDYVDEIERVVPDETTLFDGGDDGMGDVIDAEGLDRLTFVLEYVGGSLDGTCVVWGDDPSYYGDDGCELAEE